MIENPPERHQQIMREVDASARRTNNYMLRIVICYWIGWCVLATIMLGTVALAYPTAWLIVLSFFLTIDYVYNLIHGPPKNY